MSLQLTDTYARYKRYTDDLAQWLVDAASWQGVALKGELSQGGKRTSQGDKKTVAENSKAAVASSSRLKGKARKLAQQAELDANETTLAHSQSTYRLGLKDFVDLAQKITGRAQKGMTVPSHVLDKIKTIINMRRSVSEYYKLQNSTKSDSDEVTASQASHAYFIDRLQDVFNILDPFRQDGTASRTPPPTNTETFQQTTTHKTFNMFSVLAIDQAGDTSEIVSHLSTTRDRKTSTVNAKQGRKAVYAEYGRDDEFDFAVWCLFSDLHRIEDAIVNAWNRVLSGSLDAIIASVMTNAAIVLAKAAEQRFLERHQSFIGDRLSQCKGCLSLLLETIMEERHMKLGLQISMKDLPLSDFLYIRTAHNLYDPVCIEVDGLTFENDTLQDFERIPAQRSQGEEINIDERLLVERWLNCIRSRQFLEEPQGIAVDELYHGLVDLFETQHMPLWLVFAFRTSLDICYLLGSRIEEPSSRLLADISRIQAALKAIPHDKAKDPATVKSHKTLLNED